MRRNELHARKRAARKFVFENIENGFSRENVALLMPAVTITKNGCAYVDVRIFVPEIDVSETMARSQPDSQATPAPAILTRKQAVAEARRRWFNDDDDDATRHRLPFASLRSKTEPERYVVGFHRMLAGKVYDTCRWAGRSWDEAFAKAQIGASK